LHNGVVVRAGSQLTTTLRISINAADKGIELFDLQEKTLQIFFRHRFMDTCGDPDNPRIRCDQVGGSHQGRLKSPAD
jgi:hypothetical protein|tara:strand:+ start:2299 stop:2529 length:231 start_codon:yes stop_codon:yes gene_type:complete